MSTEADVEQIARIGREGYRRTYPGLPSATTIDDVVARFYQPDRIRSEVASALPSWSGYLVAEDGHGIVAAAGGGGMTGERVGEVFVLYVDPDRRGEGFGTAVLDLLTQQQAASGALEQWGVGAEGQHHGDPVLWGARLCLPRRGCPVGRHKRCRRRPNLANEATSSPALTESASTSTSVPPPRSPATMY